MDPFTATNPNTDTLSSIGSPSAFAGNSFLSNFSSTSVTAHRSACNQPHLYPDSLFTTSVGVTIPVRYLGYVPLPSSIKKVSSELRIELMTECILRVRESIARAKKQGRVMPREPNPRVAQFMGNQLSISRSGLSAIVSVTLEHLTIILTHSGEGIQHAMSMVSYAFASVDGRFATFVAKHSQLGRFCMVLQCDSSAHLVLTISQAFDLRLQKQLDQARAAFSTTTKPRRNTAQEPAIEADGYLNDNEPTDIQPQIWYHGFITREEAERRVCHDGDFLVRGSPTVRNQFVLTGMVAGQHQHLFLVDLTDNLIRNLAGHVFFSIKHFIDFHIQNGLDVEFDDQCSLQLSRPISRPQPTTLM